MVDWPAYLGTVPAWLNFGAMVSIVGLLLRWNIASRKVSIDENKQKAEELETTVGGWQSLTKRLEEENATYRQRMLDNYELFSKRVNDVERLGNERLEECHKETAALRKEVRELHTTILGLQSQIRQNGLSVVHVLPPDTIPEETKKTIDRLDMIG